MQTAKQVLVYLLVALLVVAVCGNPDGGDSPPLPGAGLSYGGIPYGSVSGNVAEFFKRQPPSFGPQRNFAGRAYNNYAPVERYL